MGRWLTAAFLLLSLVIIVVALLWETSSGPSFRAADHANMQECVQNIPGEWPPGSLDYDSAETACHYIHVRGVGQ